MTGVLNAMVAANRGSVSVTVGIGNTGSFYGFVIANIGTVTPSAYGGANIRNIVNDSSYDIQVAFEGTLAQNFFSGIVVQTTAGSFRTFLTSAATTFQQVPGSPNVTLWNWDSNTPVFTSTSPSPRIVQFF